MTWEVVRVLPEELDDLQDDIVNVYWAAFTPPPYSIAPIQVDNFAYSLRRHGLRSGFRCYVARQGHYGKVAGFTYGYTGEPGTWWRDAVAGALDPRTVNTWLNDYFELAELAVTPAMQGQGLGSRLHDRLLSGLPHRRAALSTLETETVAQKMYRRRGWLPLLHDFIFPGGREPYLIMGLDLQFRRGLDGADGLSEPGEITGRR